MRMQGGVSGKYKPSCYVLALTTLPVIKINVLQDSNSIKSTTTTYSNFKEFCRFMNANNFGIKVFNSSKELEEEKSRIIKFVETFGLEFAKQYTCLASVRNYVFLDIIVDEHYLMIFENASGDLSELKKLTRSNALTLFENVYTICYKFLKNLHSKRVCYSDLKPENIFWSITARSGFLTNSYSYRFIIGDLGSLCYPGDSNSKLSDRNYTYPDPLQSKFMNYYTFSNQARLKAAKNTWISIASAIKDPNGIFFLSVAKDWFHFGVAMIDFIIRTKNTQLQRFILPIWTYFCSRPCITDEFYSFRMLL